MFSKSPCKCVCLISWFFKKLFYSRHNTRCKVDDVSALELGILYFVIYLLLKCCYNSFCIRSVSKVTCNKFKDKHILITGGSSGLGLAIAQHLLSLKPASITIVARSEAKLEEALTHHLQNSPFVHTRSCDVTDAGQVHNMLASLEHCPDVVFACAGGAVPGLFQDVPCQAWSAQASLNYIGSVLVCQSVFQRMLKEGKTLRGRFVFIGSTLSLIGMPGYSAYASCKWAIRGLAECLRQELKPYGISVHVYFVASILSSGFDLENTIKPGVTQEIEGTADAYKDSSASPAARAAALLQGTT